MDDNVIYLNKYKRIDSKPYYLFNDDFLNIVTFFKNRKRPELSAIWKKRKILLIIHDGNISAVRPNMGLMNLKVIPLPSLKD